FRGTLAWVYGPSNIYYQLNEFLFPWAGNHDYEGIVDAELQFHTDARWVLPSRNYTFSVPISPTSTSHADFIVLDTSPFVLEYYTNPETPEQLVQLSTQHWQVSF